MVKRNLNRMLTFVAVICFAAVITVMIRKSHPMERQPMQSPRGGQVFWGTDNAGGKVAYRVLPPVRVPLTQAQSNELAGAFGRMAEAYRRGDRDAMLTCAHRLPDVVTNIPDRAFAQLVSPLARPLLYEFAHTDGRMPHELKDFEGVKDFESYVRINLDLAMFLGNMYLKRGRYDNCPLPILDAAVLEQLLLYKHKFRVAERFDMEKVADEYIKEWHGQIESENGFTRQYMWFQVDLQWSTYNKGGMTVEQLSDFVKRYARGLVRLGYTPKWLSEYDDLSEAVK